MIPKIIHFIAPSDRTKWHDIWSHCLDSWVEVCKESTIVLYNDDENIRTFVETIYPQYATFYNSIPIKIVKIDFARLCMMEHVGGIYSDMDVYCFQDFYKDLTADISFAPGWKPFPGCTTPELEEVVSNYLIAAKPNTGFFKKFIEEKIKELEVVGITKENLPYTFSTLALSDYFVREQNKYNANILNNEEHVWSLQMEQYLINKDLEKQKNLKTFHCSTRSWH